MSVTAHALSYILCALAHVVHTVRTRIRAKCAATSCGSKLLLSSMAFTSSSPPAKFATAWYTGEEPKDLRYLKKGTTSKKAPPSPG